MKLEILEPSTREAGPILVCDEDHNDIAEFFHNEHATVGQSYETALMLARKLVGTPAASEARPSVMTRLLAAAGWDAGSIRHKQLEDALDGAHLEIVDRRTIREVPPITLAKRMLEDE